MGGTVLSGLCRGSGHGPAGNGHPRRTRAPRRAVGIGHGTGPAVADAAGASATATVPRAHPYGVGRTEALVDTADAVHAACFGRTDPLWKRTYGLVRDGDSGVGPGGSAGG